VYKESVLYQLQEPQNLYVLKKQNKLNIELSLTYLQLLTNSEALPDGLD